MNFGKLPFCIRPFVEACKPLGHVTPIPIFGGNMHFLGHFPGPSDIYIYILCFFWICLFHLVIVIVGPVEKNLRSLRKSVDAACSTSDWILGTASLSWDVAVST